MTATPPDYLLAKILYIVAAAIFLAKISHWLSRPKVHRLEAMGIAFLIFGFVGALLVGALQMVRERQQSIALLKLTEEHGANSAAEKPPVQAIINTEDTRIPAATPAEARTGKPKAPRIVVPAPAPQIPGRPSTESPLPAIQLMASARRTNPQSSAHPYALEITLQTNTPIAHPHIRLEFDAPIFNPSKSFGFLASMIQDDPRINKIAPENVYEFAFRSNPVFAPDAPMTVRVYADKPFNLTKTTLVH